MRLNFKIVVSIFVSLALAGCGLTKSEGGSDAQSAPEAFIDYKPNEIVIGCKGSQNVKRSAFDGAAYQSKCVKVFLQWKSIEASSGEKRGIDDSSDYEFFCQKMSDYSLQKQSGAEWTKSIESKQAEEAMLCPEYFMSSGPHKRAEIQSIGKLQNRSDKDCRGQGCEKQDAFLSDSPDGINR